MPKLKDPRQEEFCQQYIHDFNGARAARDSGYSKKTARTQASQLLTKLDIGERIAELMRDRAERTKITQDMIVKELSIPAFADFTDFAKFHKKEGLTIVSTDEVNEKRPGATRAIKSMKETTSVGGGGSISIKLHDKIKPLELLGKHTGMFEDTGEKLASVLYQLSEKFMPSILKKNNAKK